MRGGVAIFSTGWESFYIFSHPISRKVQMGFVPNSKHRHGHDRDAWSLDKGLDPLGQVLSLPQASLTCQYKIKNGVKLELPAEEEFMN